MSTRAVTLYALALGVIAIDQLAKVLAVNFLQGQPRIAIVGDLVGLTFLRNPGAVFAVIVFISRRLASTWWAIGLGLLLGGLTGNLIDRFFRMPANGQVPQFMHGAVVDFIDLHFFVCNIADIAITGAAVVIALLTLKGTSIDGREE